MDSDNIVELNNVHHEEVMRDKKRSSSENRSSSSSSSEEEAMPPPNKRPKKSRGETLVDSCDPRIDALMSQVFIEQRQSQNNSGNNNNNNNSNTGGYLGAVAAVGALAAGGLYYLYSSKGKEKPQASQAKPTQTEGSKQPSTNSSMSGLSSSFSEKLRFANTPVISNLNGLLADIYVRHIALKDDDFEKHYKVFDTIFRRLVNEMKAGDAYFNQYSSTVQFAGSHYDRLRINKPDEFDMDIIIGLPVNLREDPLNPAKSDVVLEAKSPGFIQLKMGDQFKNLPNRDGVGWQINKAAYKWLDERNYLLRSKFTDWFKSVVDLGLQRFDRNANGRSYCVVDNVSYTLRLSSSGPAITLIIENQPTRFKLDVDLVPALKFPEERWPICKGYRKVPKSCSKEIWMVVPKPNKAGLNKYDMDRSWRLALHLQERELMHDTNNMRQAIRLIKKLRDSMGMNKIASYYIKTLFFLEAIDHENDPSYWSRNNPATLFMTMVKKFHKALSDGVIPYFWNKDNNLIGHIDKSTLTGYAKKLQKLIEVLDTPAQYKTVAKYLLPPADFDAYNKNFLHI